jgi:hypothetical protein
MHGLAAIDTATDYRSEDELCALLDDLGFITSRIARLPAAEGPGAPRPASSGRAADDFDTIRQRLTALRLQREGRCAIREGRSSADCWCYKAGSDGNSLPCPPPAGDDP